MKVDIDLYHKEAIFRSNKKGFLPLMDPDLNANGHWSGI